MSALPLTVGTKVRLTKGDGVLHGVLVSDPDVGLVIDWEIGGMSLAYARIDGWLIERDDEDTPVAVAGPEVLRHFTETGVLLLIEQADPTVESGWSVLPGFTFLDEAQARETFALLSDRQVRLVRCERQVIYTETVEMTADTTEKDR
jgi:hypothetical protein